MDDDLKALLIGVASSIIAAFIVAQITMAAVRTEIAKLRSEA